MARLEDPPSQVAPSHSCWLEASVPHHVVSTGCLHGSWLPPNRRVRRKLCLYDLSLDAILHPFNLFLFIIIHPMSFPHWRGRELDSVSQGPSWELPPWPTKGHSGALSPWCSGLAWGAAGIIITRLLLLARGSDTWTNAVPVWGCLGGGGVGRNIDTRILTANSVVPEVVFQFTFKALLLAVSQELS